MLNKYLGFMCQIRKYHNLIRVSCQVGIPIDIDNTKKGGNYNGKSD
jgi:hypothetical protein